MEGQGEVQYCLHACRCPWASHALHLPKSRGRTCVEEARLQELPQRALNAHRHEIHNVQAQRRHGCRGTEGQGEKPGRSGMGGGGAGGG